MEKSCAVTKHALQNGTLKKNGKTTKLSAQTANAPSALIKGRFIRWIPMLFFTTEQNATNRTVVSLSFVRYNEGMKAWRSDFDGEKI